MSEPVIYPKPSGATYTIPDVGEFGWGQAVTDFLVALPNGTVPTAGTFTLTGDLNFGASFGLISKYFQTESSAPADAGVVRLNTNDLIAWRNTGGTGNLYLGVDGSNRLTFNGAVLAAGGTVSSVLGTANQITSTNSGGPTVTLSFPSLVEFPSQVDIPTLNISSLLSILNGQSLNMVAGVSTTAPIAFFDTSGNFINLQAPTSLTTYSITLPSAQGGAHQLLTNDGSGNLGWTGTALTVNPSFPEVTMNGALVFSGGSMSVQPSATINVGNGPDNSNSYVAFGDAVGGQVNVCGPSTAISGSTYNLHLPTAQGSAGSVLTNDGSGNLSFSTAVSQGSSGANGIIQGTNTNDDAASGRVGEYVSSTVTSPVSLTTNVVSNITTISLTAGDWDVSGNVGLAIGSGTTLTYAIGAISDTSAVQPAAPASTVEAYFGAPVTDPVFPLPTIRVSLASTTTYYLIAKAGFSVSTLGGYGTIWARRAR